MSDERKSRLYKVYNEAHAKATAAGKTYVECHKDGIDAVAEACAKIAENCADDFTRAAGRADTSMNRALNEMGSSDCKHVAQKIREHNTKV